MASTTSIQILKCTIALLLLIAFINEAYSCSVPVGWKPEPPYKRARDVEHIVYGQVLVNYAGETREFGYPYVVGFTVYCTLRGGPFERTINVTDGDPCTDNGLEAGQERILLLSYDDYEGGYVVRNPNVQSGAIDPTEENFQEISRSGKDFDVTICMDSNGEPIDVPCYNIDEDNVACGVMGQFNFSWLFLFLGIVLVKVI